MAAAESAPEASFFALDAELPELAEEQAEAATKQKMRNAARGTILDRRFIMTSRVRGMTGSREDLPGPSSASGAVLGDP
jgi:hypothetical protein